MDNDVFIFSHKLRCNPSVVTPFSFSCLFKLKNMNISIKITQFNSMHGLALRSIRSHWGRPPRGDIISAKYILLVKNEWWCYQMETFSALLALCAGNSPVTGEFPSQRPETRSFHAFYDLRPKRRLSKNREAGDLRRYRDHHNVTVMSIMPLSRAFWPMAPQLSTECSAIVVL